MDIAYSTQTGVWYRSGNLFSAKIHIVLTAKGSSTGFADMTLPTVSGYTIAANNIFGGVDYAANMTGISSSFHGIIIAGPLMRMSDWASTGTTDIDEGNFTNTSTIIFLLNGYLT